LDGKVAKLKELLISCEGFFMDLVGGALWEGLAVMCASRQWKAVKDVCQLFYQVSIRRCNAVVMAMVNHSRSD
jgi:hypothetical protein